MKKILMYSFLIILSPLILAIGIPLIIIIVCLICAACGVISWAGYFTDFFDTKNSEVLKFINLMYTDSDLEGYGVIDKRIIYNDSLKKDNHTERSIKSKLKFIVPTLGGIATILYSIDSIKSLSFINSSNDIISVMPIGIIIVFVTSMMILSIFGLVRIVIMKKNKKRILKNKILCKIHYKSENEKHEVESMVKRFKGRYLLIKYPEYYKELNIPHIWNDLITTVIGIVSILLLSTGLLLILNQYYFILLEISKFVYLIIYIVMLLISSSFFIKCIIQTSIYSKYLSNNIDMIEENIEKTATQYKDEVKYYIKRGETRLLSLKYLDLYKQLNAPHLWNSYINSEKIGKPVFFSLITIFITAIIYCFL